MDPSAARGEQQPPQRDQPTARPVPQDPRNRRGADPRYRDQPYSDPSYPHPADRHPAYRDAEFRDADYRGFDYRDADYRDPDFRDWAYRDYPARGYADPEYADPDSAGRAPFYDPAAAADPDDDGRPYDEGKPAARDEGKPLERGQRLPHRRGHLPPYTEPDLASASDARSPRKLTVTRIAALRSKELTNRGVQLFRRAASADGADQSGLTHLTYAVMANYATDAALTVALANTLFFAAAAGESTSKVLLYLLITVAPFAVIAPFIGPLLDRVQNGRRIALSVCSFGRSLLAIIMAFNFHSWILYPCALGMMVLSKAFGVLKAALTPRVLPEQITLVKTNSRLTVFGLVAGGVSGAIAAAFAGLSNSSGALVWTALCGVAGGILCIKIPAWVESTAGEVPVQHSEILERGKQRTFPPIVSATLWANIANRIETGFLALFIAFVVKTEYTHVSGFGQLLLLGIVGAAAGAGGFLGNALGAKLTLSQPEKVAAFSVAGVAVTTLIAAALPGLAMGAVVGLVGSTSSSLAKVCLDSVIQDRLPERSRASAFGMSESALQLAWVFGGVVGLLLGGIAHLHGRPAYMVGFAVVTVLILIALTQSWLAKDGRTLLPGLAAALHRKSGTPSHPTQPTQRHQATSNQQAYRPTDAGQGQQGQWQQGGGQPTRPQPAAERRGIRKAGKPR
ncbi:MAG: MFS transporter [Actinomycetota bacterium]|nr:MFS transporter [Actinomycetota bacterium]